MISGKILSWSISGVICLLLVGAGCAPAAKEAVREEVELKEPVPELAEEAVKPEVEAEKPITVALKFAEQDSTTYKLITQMEDSVKFEGSLSDDPTFENRTNGRTIEMTFTQQIQSVNDQGNAIAKITIDGLKYLVIQINKTVQDFDSSREEDKANPLAKLIGQSYTIEVSSAGEVVKVSDVQQARAAVQGSSSANRAALKLLSEDEIKERHRAFDLPSANKNNLRTGDHWSSIKSFSFGKMGSKAYEKIYTLKEVKDKDNRRLAVVEMSTIPTSETAELENQITNVLAKMFDNIETYTGRLKLDLTAGKVEEYREKLQSEWVAVDPEAKGDREPDTVRMGVIRSYKLEKID